MVLSRAVRTRALARDGAKKRATLRRTSLSLAKPKGVSRRDGGVARGVHDRDGARRHAVGHVGVDLEVRCREGVDWRRVRSVGAWLGCDGCLGRDSKGHGAVGDHVSVVGSDFHDCKG